MAMIRPAGQNLAALGVAVLGGFLIGQLGELETVLLAGLGCLVGLVLALGAPAHTRHAQLWPAVACLVLGGGAGLVAARVPIEESVSFAVRSVALNPVILAGFAVGARLSWACLRWAARPRADAPSAASRPARQPARTTGAGNR